MVVELLDDWRSFEDDARLLARLAFHELPDTGPDELPPWPEDERAQSVAEILALVDRLGPCSESVMLLESLTGRELTDDEWLSVALAWRPVLAWASGSQLAAVAEFAGPVPPEVVAAQGIARGEDLDPSVSMLSAALGVHRGAAASMLHEARTLYGKNPAAPTPDALPPRADSPGDESPGAESQKAALGDAEHDRGADEHNPDEDGADPAGADSAPTGGATEATALPGPYGEGLLTATGGALLAGHVDVRRAAVLVQQLSVLPPELARTVEAGVLPRVMGGTLGNLRQKIRRRIVKADPDAATKRFLDNRKQTRVELDTDGEDGLITLTATLPPTEGLAVYQRLEQIAGRYHRDDGRSKPQRLADALIGCVLGFQPRPCHPCPDHATHTACGAGTGTSFGDRAGTGTGTGTREDAVLTGSAAARGGSGDDAATEGVGSGSDSGCCGTDCGWGMIPAQVPVTLQVTLDLPTLLRLRDNPAELHGYGPLPAEVARALAADATWQRFVHDPIDGHLLDRGHTSYRPGTVLSDYLHGRDHTCRFPGCTLPIDDLDHIEPWNHDHPPDGGTTSSDNLQGLCRYHHRVKTHARFHVTHQGQGRLTWTTPHGRAHTTQPHDYRPDTDTDPP